MKSKVLVLSFLICFSFVACDSTTITTPTDSASPVLNTDDDNIAKWTGVWVLKSETIASSAGTMTSPGSGTILKLNSDMTAEEDYSHLIGYGEACSSTVGKNTGTWSISEDGDSIGFNHATAVKVIDPYISCGTGAGTTAVPRSVIRFAYGATDWQISLSSDGQTMTARIAGPGGTGAPTLTQVYRKH